MEGYKELYTVFKYMKAVRSNYRMSTPRSTAYFQTVTSTRQLWLRFYCNILTLRFLIYPQPLTQMIMSCCFADHRLPMKSTVSSRIGSHPLSLGGFNRCAKGSLLKDCHDPLRVSARYSPRPYCILGSISMLTSCKSSEPVVQLWRDLASFNDNIATRRRPNICPLKQ
jgi:hypothetical protein